MREAAERHCEPGCFKTVAGSEYSSVLADRGKHHRIVIFRSMAIPWYAILAVEAPSEADLWQKLERHCIGNCAFLRIPHNANKSWGLAFASKTIDGIPNTEADWRLRQKHEPLVEMSQIKGSSERSVAFGAGDEECGFEQFYPTCAEGRGTSRIYPTSIMRDGSRKAWHRRTSCGSTRCSLD